MNQIKQNENHAKYFFGIKSAAISAITRLFQWKMACIDKKILHKTENLII